MKLFFIILLNILLLFGFKYLSGIGEEDFLKTIEVCSFSDSSLCAFRTYLMAGIFLGIASYLVVDILRILKMPAFFVTILALTLALNAIIFSLFGKILSALKIENLGIDFGGVINLIILVAIFTFFNTLYSVLFNVTN